VAETIFEFESVWDVVDNDVVVDAYLLFLVEVVGMDSC